MANCQGRHSLSISVESFDAGDPDRTAKWKCEDAPFYFTVKSSGIFLEKDVGKSFNISVSSTCRSAFR